MPAGRPTLLTQEVIDTATEYLDNFKTVHGHMIPSVAGLAKILKIHRDTLYGWVENMDDESTNAELKKEISYILQVINNDQEFELINGGLSGVLNSNITKLVLGKHGYHERQELSGPDGRPIETDTTYLVEIVSAEDTGS